jgi:hypothetical protein
LLCCIYYTLYAFMLYILHYRSCSYVLYSHSSIQQVWSLLMLSCCIPLLFYDVVMYRAMVIQLLSLMHLKQKMLILVLVCMQLLLALEFILLVPYYLINSCCAGGTMNLVCQKVFSLLIQSCLLLPH